MDLIAGVLCIFALVVWWLDIRLARRIKADLAEIYTVIGPCKAKETIFTTQPEWL